MVNGPGVFLGSKHWCWINFQRGSNLHRALRTEPCHRASLDPPHATPLWSVRQELEKPQSGPINRTTRPLRQAWTLSTEGRNDDVADASFPTTIFPPLLSHPLCPCPPRWAGACPPLHRLSPTAIATTASAPPSDCHWAWRGATPATRVPCPALPARRGRALLACGCHGPPGRRRRCGATGGRGAAAPVAPAPRRPWQRRLGRRHACCRRRRGGGGPLAWRL